jgi:membrane associated rhomboid family serine protease
MIPLRDNVRSRTFPFVNWALILGNVYGFYREIAQPDPETLAHFLKRCALVPAALTAAPEKAWPTIFSAMFLHGGWLHLIGNMLYLWIFGDNVEDRMGHRRYLVFYLLCGLFAALAEVALSPGTALPMLGASGAIAGVMGAYFLLYPKARIVTVIPIWIFLKVVEVPAIFFLGFWFLIQAFQGWGTLAMAARPSGGVAWWAHAGGFVAGGVLVFFFKKPGAAGAGPRRSR